VDIRSLKAYGGLARVREAPLGGCNECSAKKKWPNALEVPNIGNLLIGLKGFRGQLSPMIDFGAVHIGKGQRVPEF
jgi:hypothetical protein